VWNDNQLNILIQTSFEHKIEAGVKLNIEVYDMSDMTKIISFVHVSRKLKPNVIKMRNHSRNNETCYAEKLLNDRFVREFLHRYTGYIRILEIVMYCIMTWGKYWVSVVEAAGDGLVFRVDCVSNEDDDYWSEAPRCDVENGKTFKKFGERWKNCDKIEDSYAEFEETGVYAEICLENDDFEENEDFVEIGEIGEIGEYMETGESCEEIGEGEANAKNFEDIGEYGENFEEHGEISEEIGGGEVNGEFEKGLEEI
jgi:hypothetical protein